MKALQRANENILLVLLMVATALPLFLGRAGIAVTLIISVAVFNIALQRPDLGRRWYVLALLPAAVWIVFFVLGLTVEGGTDVRLYPVEPFSAD